MPFVKIVKNKAYFKRFQTQFRRRREGKTDYHAREHLIFQAKNKYNTPKYRMVVRLTNTTVICQIVFAQMNGDKVLASAYSSELPRFGLKVGLKNYPAAYCTGLLLARRLLQKLSLDTMYPAVAKVNGEIIRTKDGKETYFVSKVSDQKYPFQCYLDVGIRRTTLGCRLFGALKGAVDGGLSIPHNEKNFPGYDKQSKKYDAKVHRGKIFGENIKSYMESLSKEEPEKYQKLFHDYIKLGVKPTDLEKLYTSVHEAIKKDPAVKLSDKTKVAKDTKFKKGIKITHKQFINRIKQKKAAHAKALKAENAEE